MLYDSTLCIGCKACVAACKAANDMPADIPQTSDRLEREYLGFAGGSVRPHAQRHQGLSQRHGGEEGPRDRRFCLRQAALPALRRSVLRLGLPGRRHAEGPGDRHRHPQCGRLHRLPLLRLRLPVRRAAIRLQQSVRQDRQVPVLQPSAEEGQDPRLLRRLSDRRLAVRHGQGHSSRRSSGGSPPLPARLINSRAASSAATGRPTRRRSRPTSKAVYGEHEAGGTQVRYLAGVPFPKLGLPTLGPQSPASLSEGMQHTLYHWLIAPIVAFLGFAFLARRNMAQTP